MPKLAVIITAYNRADFVGRCVQSVLAAKTAGWEVRVWVMDNGSVDTTGHAARAAGAHAVLRTEENRHIVEVLNRGLDTAARDWPEADYVLVLNDDTEFPEGALARLLAVAQEHSNAILTPLQLNYRAPEHIDVNALGHAQQVAELVEDAVLGRPLRPAYDVPTIIGAAMLAPSALWRRIGPFDPLFFFYGIDDDYCTRARFHGYRTMLVPGAHLLHAHGKLDGTAKQPPSKRAIYQKWRNETQARYLFLLKEPSHPLAWGYLRAAKLALRTFLGCVRYTWPQGAISALTLYGWCLTHAPQIAAARRRHFDKGTRATPE